MTHRHVNDAGMRPGRPELLDPIPIDELIELLCGDDARSYGHTAACYIAGFYQGTPRRLQYVVTAFPGTYGQGIKRPMRNHHSPALSRRHFRIAATVPLNEKRPRSVIGKRRQV